MLTRRQSGGLVLAISMGLFSVGCFTNKSKEAVETGAPPPPSAYPTGTTAYPNGTAPAPGSMPAAPSSSMASATNSPVAAPAPFQLRQGEQLVPYVVVSGDSLSSIAGKFNSSTGRIQSANEMKDTKIFAGKTIQVPTSAPPANLAMNAATAAPGTGYTAAPAPGTIVAPGVSPYPSTVAPPVIPQVPTMPGGVAGVPPIQVPANPAATSYPREGAIAPPVTPGVPTTIPSFQGSRIQFGN